MNDHKTPSSDQIYKSETPPEGLTEEEAARRAAAGQRNRTTADPGTPVWQILCKNLFTPFNLLNFLLAGLLLLAHSYRNMLFLGVVFSNTLIGTVQELKAHRTITKLKLLNASKTHVIRGGKEKEIPSDHAVRGDLIVLRAGDEVPADAVIRTGFADFDESVLTGESDPVTHRTGEEILSGSHLIAGQVTAVLTRVGDESYAAQLTKTAKTIKRPQSQMMRDLKRLIRVIGAVLIPLGALLMCKQVFIRSVAWQDAVPTVVAAMIGMIPEGLMLLTSVALAVGVIRLGKRQTLVQELYGIETLARTDVLCLDKTGTLTTGDMRVEAAFPFNCDEKELKTHLGRFLSAFDPVSPTLKALHAYAPRGADTPVSVLPFSSARKCSAAAFGDGNVYVLGAPAFVLEDLSPVRKIMDEQAALGRRVLVLCRAEGPLRENEVPRRTQILGLFSISDALRAGAEETLRYFKEQGVALKVISGDDPQAVSVIGQRLGLAGAENRVDATGLSDEALVEAADRYTVFGRVTPAQKKTLVTALKAAGHHVTMTGDGVNDIPAMKAADCSVAMGSGSDAARHVAQITLLDSDFSSLPHVVWEGRRVIGNITRSASLFLVKTLYSFILTLLALPLPLRYPFQPIQLTLISTLTIGTPAFFLAFEPNKERITGRFLDTVLKNALPGAVGVALCAVFAMLLEDTGLAYESCSALAVLSAGIMGLMELYGVCRPLNALRGAVFGGMCAALAAAVAFFGKVFFLDVWNMPLRQWLILAGMAAAGLVIMSFTGWLLNRAKGGKRDAA